MADNDNQNENDGLLLKFLSGAAETLDKYLGEASRTIINQGLSDADAAILRIEKTIEASIEIRLQAQAFSTQVVADLPNSSKLTIYFEQLVVKLDTYVNLLPDRLNQLKEGLIDLDLAQAKLLTGQTLEVIKTLTHAAGTALFVLETFQLVDALLAGDNREAAIDSFGTLVGLGIGALALPILSGVTAAGAIATAIGAGIGIVTTIALKALIGEEDYDAFISIVSNIAEDLLVPQINLDNGVELEVGNEILHGEIKGDATLLYLGLLPGTSNRPVL